MIDRLGVTLVALDGHRMNLDEKSGQVAMRIMIDKGLSLELVAYRLCRNPRTLKAWRKREQRG